MTYLYRTLLWCQRSLVSCSLACLAGCVLALYYTDLSWMLLPGIVVGVLYEHLVEWATHGWLQHQPSRLFRYFVQRHARHHRQVTRYQSLENNAVLLPVIALLLSPACAVLAFYPAYQAMAAGVIVGFLAAHIYLNALHYDLHAPSPILPGWLRHTAYYRTLASMHRQHHYGVRPDSFLADYRIYSVSNPWLDAALDRMGAARAMDIAFGWVERLTSSRARLFLWPPRGSRSPH